MKSFYDFVSSKRVNKRKAVPVPNGVSDLVHVTGVVQGRLKSSVPSLFQSFPRRALKSVLREENSSRSSRPMQVPRARWAASQDAEEAD